VEHRLEVSAETLAAGVPTPCLSSRSVDNEVGYLKRFIAGPLGHYTKMDGHTSPSDRRKTAAEGEECWRLYSQAIAPKIAPDQPGPARPREMFVCEPARREPFVSGLSDWPRR
jgi:hypothetical protein